MPTAASAFRRLHARLALVCGAAFAVGFGVAVAGRSPAEREATPPAAPPIVATAAPVLLLESRLPPSSPPAVVAAPTAAAREAPVPVVTSAPAPTSGSEHADLEVRRGDTLLGVLDRAGIDPAQAYAAAGTLREVADLRRLRPGQRLAVELAPADGTAKRLLRLVWPVAVASELHLVSDGEGGFAARMVERTLRQELRRFGGPITDSLYQTAERAGLPVASVPQMVALLSWDLDLQREVHPGDGFEAVLERRVTADGAASEWGDLQFLAFRSREHQLEAYRFATAPGRAEFYDREGRPLRKWLLRTPVDGARLSSNFGRRRHPVLGYTRMHKGIDFAAPTGTPILAAADGVVEFVGRNRGYGRYVRIRHNAEYTTAYAHMSRFAPSIRKGERVEQGTVVGAVGATGLATGPHLHYEVLQRGVQVDPLRLKTARAEALRGEDLSRFTAWRERIDALRQGSGETLVAERAD